MRGSSARRTNRTTPLVHVLLCWEMAPGLIGCDPTQLLSLHRTMDGLLAGHAYAKAAIDIAAYDLCGKQLGLRVADLLGGAVTERVPSYYASGIGDPDDIAQVAC